MKRTWLILATLFLGLVSSATLGQTAGMLVFQGLVRDAEGDPITVPLDLEFRIYDAETLGNLVDVDGDGVVENACGEDVNCVSALSVTDVIVSTKFGPVHLPRPSPA